MDSILDEFEPDFNPPDRDQKSHPKKIQAGIKWRKLIRKMGRNQGWRQSLRGSMGARKKQGRKT